jgi:hypothetical protein
MRRRDWLRLAPVAAALAGAAWIGRASVGAQPRDVDTLIAHVSDRVAAYYKRAQQVICLERSTVVPIEHNWSLAGFARTVESELRVEMAAADGDGLPEPQVTREIRRINGREPRDRDKKDRSGCTDPNPLSPEPLAFLLPGRRGDYHFTTVRDARERNRAALVVDFMSSERKSRPELIEDEHGHDDCFDWKGPVAMTGRLWIDAESYDVLRLERSTPGPTDVRVPATLQRKYHFLPYLTLERDDLTLRYREVVFHNPTEIVLLPESIESLTVFRTTLQSMRRTQTFTDYRRFLIDSRIKGPATAAPPGLSDSRSRR